MKPKNQHGKKKAAAPGVKGRVGEGKFGLVWFGSWRVGWLG